MVTSPFKTLDIELLDSITNVIVTAPGTMNFSLFLTGEVGL